MFRWQAHKASVQSLAFAPGGGLLATATGSSKFVHLWDPRTGTLARKLDAGMPVLTVAFAPGAPLLAAASHGFVRVWETAAWERVADLAEPNASNLFELALGPGPRPALAASPSGYISVWHDASVRAGDHRRRPDERVPVGGHGVACLAFTPDGRLGTNNLQETALWDPATGLRLRGWDRPESGNRGPIQFSPDGRRVAYAHTKYIVVTEVDTPAGGATAPVTLTGHTRPVWAVGWSADGRVLMTTSGDGTARLWDADTGAERRLFDWGVGKIYAAAFAPDGMTAAAGGEKGQVVVWDVDL